MSRLVTSSPTSGATTSTPFSASNRATVPHTTNSSSYLVAPSPLRIAVTRRDSVSGASASRLSTRILASSDAEGRSRSETPGSPWMPSPSPIRPSGTSNSGLSCPGSVQPSKATPRLRVRPLACWATRTTSSKEYPSSAAAEATLNTTKSPTTPRRLVCSAAGALATSSVTTTLCARIPSRSRRSTASPKFMLSPA